MTSPFAGLIDPPAELPCRGRTDPIRMERARAANVTKKERRHKEVPNPWKLTGTEWACLVELTTGKTQSDAADVVGISPKTLTTHLYRAKDKMGAITATHAVLMVDRYIRGGARPDVEVVLRLTGGRPTVELREAA